MMHGIMNLKFSITFLARVKKIHAAVFLLAVPLLRLTYQQLSHSSMTGAYISIHWFKSSDGSWTSQWSLCSHNCCRKIVYTTTGL